MQQVTTWDGQTVEWPFVNKPAREVQLEALAAGFGMPGFAYFMRQRLGKTWLAYAEYTLLKEQEKVKWFILICPNSLKEQWKEAIEEVDPYSPICIYESNQKKKVDHFFSKNKLGGVFIINFESMRSFMKDEGWNRFETLKTYLVADESTKIKEPTAKMTKACHELASVCSYKRILTGKPVANNNADIWAQLKFIGATERNYYQHKYTFCIVGGFQGRQIVKNVNTEMLKEEIAPFCYIAPDKYLSKFEKVYEPMRFVPLAGTQLQMYKDMEDSLLLELSNDVKITAPIALVKYLRLQQISSGVAGDIDGLQHNIVDPFDNPRIKNVLAILENEITNKVIIVCRFNLSIRNLFDVLTERGYICAVMQGGMDDELTVQKKRFTDGEAQILIAQEQVLSFGHTLCGPDIDPCTDMIFYENSFSLINRSQCESRPEKLERDQPISYWDMFASKMDKYIITSLIRKEDASMALMGYSRKYGVLNQGV
mgnify:CR=1 FL=1